MPTHSTSTILTLAQPSPADGATPANRLALVLFCAEQGFAGAFNELVLDAVGPDVSKSELFLIGSRGQAIAAERGIAATWTSAMPSHFSGVPGSLTASSTLSFPALRVARSTGSTLFSTDGGATVERRHLFPVNLSAIPLRRHAEAPLLNLPAATLLHALNADYVHALICNATLHAFATENEARMTAMAAARNQIERELSVLQAPERRVRHEAITAEIIELVTGKLASRGD